MHEQVDQWTDVNTNSMIVRKEKDFKLRIQNKVLEQSKSALRLKKLR